MDQQAAWRQWHADAVSALRKYGAGRPSDDKAVLVLRLLAGEDVYKSSQPEWYGGVATASVVLCG